MVATVCKEVQRDKLVFATLLNGFAIDQDLHRTVVLIGDRHAGIGRVELVGKTP